MLIHSPVACLRMPESPVFGDGMNTNLCQGGVGVNENVYHLNKGHVDK